MSGKKEGVLLGKSFAFAIRVVRLYKHLVEDKRKFVLGKQLLRSRTAVGALMKEAQNAESKADFIRKLAIARKECDGTCYWLELLKETGYLSEKEYESIGTNAAELLKMIRSAILTTKQKTARNP